MIRRDRPKDQRDSSGRVERQQAFCRPKVMEETGRSRMFPALSTIQCQKAWHEIGGNKLFVLLESAWIANQEMKRRPGTGSDWDASRFPKASLVESAPEPRPAAEPAFSGTVPLTTDN